MTPRSYLFVPADRPERFAKALAAGADAVVIDLEDAVAPESKDSARVLLAEWLAQTSARIVVRINSVDTAWFADDLRLCGATNVAGIMVPKAERAEYLPQIREKPLLPLIESAAGMDGLREIARAPNVERLVFGSIDFQLDLGIDGDGDELLMFRSQIVLASRLSQLAAPVDGVTTSISDPTTLDDDVRRARRLGFGAKLCIHPKQVAGVNQGFSPSAEQVDWARRVMSEAASSGGAAVAVDGKMIDKPVLLRAQRLLNQVSTDRRPTQA